MALLLLEFAIVDEKNRRLWVRDGVDFSAAQALAALDAVQARFASARLFLQAIATDEIGRAPRRLMLRGPNLRTARLQAEAVHGAEPGFAEPVPACHTAHDATHDAAHPSAHDAARDRPGDDTSSGNALIDVQLWHRRLLIRHLNYPGLSFATEAPERVARADFERVADFLVPAHQPLNAVFRLSQNTGHSWLPGADRRSTSIGDVLVIAGRRGVPASVWMVMAMGFDRIEAFD